jgi:hypothetical protein
MQAQASLDGKPSTLTPSFPQGQCCTRCYTAKSNVKKCRCRCRGQHHGQAYKREADSFEDWLDAVDAACDLHGQAYKREVDSCEKEAEAAYAKLDGTSKP